jgi:hypothetical protein
MWIRIRNTAHQKCVPSFSKEIAFFSLSLKVGTLQRQNTEISKQIFSEKEYRGLSPNFHIYTSVGDFACLNLRLGCGFTTV